MKKLPSFRHLSVPERIRLLTDEHTINAQQAHVLQSQYEQSLQSPALGLDAHIAEHIVEHQIGQYTLPIGIVRALVVNHKNCNILVATEEPSVIAAACNGAKITAASGGITAKTNNVLTNVDIVFSDCNSTPTSERLYDQLQHLLKERQEELLHIAHQAHPSIVRHGGGVRCFTIHQLPGFVKLTLHVDTGNAMGANIVNTIGEAIKTHLDQWLNKQSLVAILSNTCATPTVAETWIPLNELVRKESYVNLEPAQRKQAILSDGRKLAERIALLSRFAMVDPTRAATHNKGIANGIAGAALASGNDTRALQAAAYAWASRNGSMQPLSTWEIVESTSLPTYAPLYCYEFEKNDTRMLLHGRIEIPLQVGIVGGAINSLPMAQLALSISGVKENNEYRNMLAALGLVQNLAALRALAGPGIQAGHMRLQVANIAMSVGAQGEEIAHVAFALSNLAASDRDQHHALLILQQLRANKEDKTS